MINTNIKLTLLCSVLLFITSCGTHQFINKPAETFQKFSCEIKTEVCGLEYNNGGFIKYEVTEIEALTYQVTGKVDMDWISTGTSKFVIFYVIFMDENSVIHERRISTRGTHVSFGFEFQTEVPILTSTLEKVRWMIRT